MEYAHQGFVSRGLLEEVNECKEDLDNVQFRQAIFNSLVQDSLWHSDLIEQLSRPNLHRRKRRRLKKMDSPTLDNLVEAWSWLHKNNVENPKITAYVVQEVAFHIDPCLRDYGLSYRKDSVKLQNVDFLPPRAEKIDREMEQIYAIVNSKVVHPVERALHFHLHCARVQPMYDCNKRTARLLQNFVLVSEDFLPINILVDEAQTYINLLVNAFEGYRNRKAQDKTDLSGGESVFYQFLAEKILSSYDHALTEAEPRPIYEVVFSSSLDVGHFFDAKHLLESYLRTHDIEATIRANKRERKHLLIEGNIDPDCVRKCLKSYPISKIREMI